jgi:hypothetical protein
VISRHKRFFQTTVAANPDPIRVPCIHRL